ncbi:MAG: Ribosomal small subunit methyltransferase [Myxococcaceae bacterium]|nr:Ribosomal small subunit methyltransferase [Myxococcaceae bacterium]
MRTPESSPAAHLMPIQHAGELALGQKIELCGAQVRALRFRQLNAKEAFTVVDASGRYFRASLSVLLPERGEALVYEQMPSSPESPAHITLLCAVLARQRMLAVIQKATELGVMCVQPVLSERSVQAGGLEHEKAHAWPAQALRAARQCRRASIPDVRAPLSLEAALLEQTFRSADCRFYLDDRTASDAPLGGERVKPRRVVFVVGPEGGFTDQERACLRQHDARALQLGGRVLRAETAVFVGLTLLQHAYGDL